MNDTLNVGNAVQSGSQNTPLERLRPFQIAMRLLPTAPVTVMEATDEQFQELVDAHGIKIEDEEPGWSFDDRVRLINTCRRHGQDLFTLPNKKSSEPGTKTIQNNSHDRIISELFVTDEAACVAGSGHLSKEALEDAIDMTKQQFPDWNPE